MIYIKIYRIQGDDGRCSLAEPMLVIKYLHNGVDQDKRHFDPVEEILRIT
ncbi:MAG TPA: hypothetical protein GX502_03825 [Syntrophaceticus sp.]|nr:hypothetical protein [Syntrophaceticus sp.]